MSDPMFLRNLINNTVYAEQIHSAQQSAQEAARQKNIRVQQQKIREKALAVEKLGESANLGIGEKGQEQRPQDDGEPEEGSEKSSSENIQKGQGDVQRIDITV